MMPRWVLMVALVGAWSFVLRPAASCNEAVCASVVSKCMLTKSCNCDLKNCSCCKECFSCLSYLYSECCSCVDMCPKPNDTSSALSKKSHVEDFPDSVPVPVLFQALMGGEPDPLQRWLTITFPVDFDISSYRPKHEKEMKVFALGSEQEVAPRKDIITLNCTVAYMHQCMSWNKCKASCQSTGASSYRWFHDGCCECVGESCINYGINESRCVECPLREEKLAEEDESLLDYGETKEEVEEEEKKQVEKKPVTDKKPVAEKKPIEKKPAEKKPVETD